MNFRLTLLYAAALLLAAASPPGSAATKKFDCRYRMTLPADPDAPESEPTETKLMLTEWQRQTLVKVAMAESSAPDPAMIRALARAVGQ